jgi:hypothetical protein
MNSSLETRFYTFFFLLKYLLALIQLYKFRALLIMAVFSVRMSPLLSLLYLQFVFGTPVVDLPPAQSAACREIAVGTAKTLLFPDALADPDYLFARTHYWSAANADSTPACVVFPTNREEVSYVVKVLQKYPAVNFAVKSGGHNPNVGFSSVDNGVLISLSSMATTTFDADSRLAVVQPGSRWSQAIEALEPYNVTVVGGRLGDVGVGGLLLGGGLSFLSAQRGLACDSVVNYGVVLANGTIVDANATNNLELFRALKGGGNQFGIVTDFTLRTYPVGQVWGGHRFYNGLQTLAVIEATKRFTETNTDNRAAVIVTFDLVIPTLDTVTSILDLSEVNLVPLLFFFYDGLQPPVGVFDDFDAIPSASSTTKTRSYGELLEENNVGSIYGFRYLLRAGTLPNLSGQTGVDLYLHALRSWLSYISRRSLLIPGFIFSISFQPFPYTIAAASQSNGGNILNLNPADGDHMWIEYSVSWLTAAGDGVAHTMMREVTQNIASYTTDTYANVPNSHQQSPSAVGNKILFYNDAMSDQDPFQSLDPSTYESLKSYQIKNDPTGFFSNRTGGFKFT